MAKTAQLFALSKMDLKIFRMYSGNQIAVDYASEHSRLLDPSNVQNVRIVLARRQPGVYRGFLQGSVVLTRDGMIMHPEI